LSQFPQQITGNVQNAVAPVLLMKKFALYVLEQHGLIVLMLLNGHAAEIEQLRKETPDPLILALCLGICSAIKAA
jgi:hypothetical protein